MNQPPQKKSNLDRIRGGLSKVRPEDWLLLIIAGALFAFYFFIVLGLEAFVSFETSFLAGILGIMIGFDLDRRRKRFEDDRIKKDFLALMRNELTDIKVKIPPQEVIPLMLYPEVWDSFVSSGLVRLLNSEQVTKLSTVYKSVKGFQYEAEWIRRIVEEYESIPDIEKERKQRVAERYSLLQRNYVRSGEQLSKEIDKLLKEKWWSSESSMKEIQTH